MLRPKGCRLRLLGLKNEEEHSSHVLQDCSSGGAVRESDAMENWHRQTQAQAHARHEGSPLLSSSPYPLAKDTSTRAHSFLLQTRPCDLKCSGVLLMGSYHHAIKACICKSPFQDIQTDSTVIYHSVKRTLCF